MKDWSWEERSNREFLLPSSSVSITGSGEVTSTASASPHPAPPSLGYECLPAAENLLSCLFDILARLSSV